MNINITGMFEQSLVFAVLKIIFVEARRKSFADAHGQYQLFQFYYTILIEETHTHGLDI